MASASLIFQTLNLGLPCPSCFSRFQAISVGQPKSLLSPSLSFQLKESSNTVSSHSDIGFLLFALLDPKLLTMGAQFSKRSGDSSSHGAHLPNQMNSDSQVTADLSSYEIDPDLQSFDSTLPERPSRDINTLAIGVDVQSLSLDSLRDVTGCLLEMNQEVVEVILEYKEDIWNNHDLSDLVKEYFEHSLLTLDFCTALEKCLKRARDSQLIVQVALQQFEEEQREEVDGGERKYFEKTLQELKNFKAAGDPFTAELFSLFRFVYKQQMSMLEKLQLRKRKLDNKLKSPNTWWKVSNVKSEREIIFSMQIGTYIAIDDLKSIGIVVGRLEIEVEYLFQNADFALQQEEVVILVMDEIKKKLNGFMQTIDDLCEHADKFSRDIRRARTVIMQRIIKHPSND